MGLTHNFRGKKEGGLKLFEVWRGAKKCDKIFLHKVSLQQVFVNGP